MKKKTNLFWSFMLQQYVTKPNESIVYIVKKNNFFDFQIFQESFSAFEGDPNGA